MHKHILLALLLGCLLGTAQAQRIHAYVNAGAIGSQIEGDELKGMNHWGFTGGFGAFANLDDHNTWGLSVETDYSLRGVSQKTRTSGTPYMVNLDLHYVDIPLTLFYRDPIGGLNIGLGLVYGRLISQPHGTILYDPSYFVPDTSDMQFLKNDLSPAVEIRFNVWRGLQLSARYQFSVIKVKQDWHFNDVHNDQVSVNDCYNQSVQLRLLWQFGDEDTRYSNKRKHTNKKRRY